MSSANGVRVGGSGAQTFGSGTERGAMGRQTLPVLDARVSGPQGNLGSEVAVQGDTEPNPAGRSRSRRGVPRKNQKIKKKLLPYIQPME